MEIECVERGRAFRHGDLCEREDGSLGTNRHPTIRRSHFRSEKRVEEHFARPRLIGSDYIVFLFFFFCLLFFFSFADTFDDRIVCSVRTSSGFFSKSLVVYPTRNSNFFA